MLYAIHRCKYFRARNLYLFSFKCPSHTSYYTSLCVTYNCHAIELLSSKKSFYCTAQLKIVIELLLSMLKLCNTQIKRYHHRIPADSLSDIRQLPIESDLQKFVCLLARTLGNNLRLLAFTEHSLLIILIINQIYAQKNVRFSFACHWKTSNTLSEYAIIL